MARNKVTRPNILVLKNGRWYENGKCLYKKDYIYHASASEGASIISCITGQKYRLNGKARYVM